MDVAVGLRLRLEMILEPVECFQKAWSMPQKVAAIIYDHSATRASFLEWYSLTE